MADAQQHNVDPEEIKKFDDLASTWWDLEGDFKPLHDMNPIRKNYIDEHSPLCDKQVIDIGCGGGILTEAMAQRGAFVTGLDMGEGPLEVAKLHALESELSIDYQRETVEQYAERHAETFDVVTCLEMLEHVPDPASVVKACASLAKPGGRVYFSTINRNPKSFLLAIVGAEYIARLLPRGTHQYKKLIKPSELSRWVRDADMLVEDITGILYNPLTRRFSTSPTDVDVNYIVCAHKPA